jgi:hypothetical protein
MAVSAGYTPAVYTGNDTTYVFPFAWPILAASHLVVVHTDALGVETTLVKDTNYTLTWTGIGQPGSISRFRYVGLSRVDYPLATGETLTISRAVPVEQPTSLKTQGKLSAEILERAYDRLCMIDQQTLTLLLDHAHLHIPGASSALPWDRIHGYGVSADRPAASAAVAGYLYYSYDIPILEICTGSTWLSYAASELPAVETKTASFTAVPGIRYLINAASAAITMTLPATPAVNTFVGALVIDATHTVTIGRNGARLVGEDEDKTIENAGDGVDLIYTGASFGWSPVNELSVSERDVPQSAADLPFTPTIGIAATTTQEAVEEVAADAAQALATANADAAANLATAVAALNNDIDAVAAEADDNALVYALIFGG